MCKIAFSVFLNFSFTIESADYIDIASLNVTVIGNKIKLRWDEPAKANGIAMSYNINVTRVDSSKSNVSIRLNCLF